MTTISWIYMALVWAAILALNAFCFYRILFKSEKIADVGESERGEGS